jgi:DnaJ-class molecular chaperone
MNFENSLESRQEREPKKKCPDCNGTGKDKAYSVVFKEPKDQKDCSRCKGSGQIKA